MRFMVHRGLNTGLNPLSEAVHWVIERFNPDTDGRDVLPTLEFLVKEARISPNMQVSESLRCMPGG